MGGYGHGVRACLLGAGTLTAGHSDGVLHTAHLGCSFVCRQGRGSFRHDRNGQRHHMGSWDPCSMPAPMRHASPPAAGLPNTCLMPLDPSTQVHRLSQGQGDGAVPPAIQALAAELHRFTSIRFTYGEVEDLKGVLSVFQTQLDKV